MKRFVVFSLSTLCLMLAVLIGFLVGSRSARSEKARDPIASVLFLPQENAYLFVLEDGDFYFATEKELADGAPAKYVLNVFEQREPAAMPTKP